MSAIGSVKNRLRTMFFINKNRKRKIKEEEQIQKEKQIKDEQKKKDTIINIVPNKYKVVTARYKIIEEKKPNNLEKNSKEVLKFEKFFFKNDNILKEKIGFKDSFITNTLNKNDLKENKLLNQENIINNKQSLKKEKTENTLIINSIIKEKNSLNNKKSIEENSLKNEELIIKKRLKKYLSKSKQEIKKLKQNLEITNGKLKKAKTKEELNKVKNELDLLKEKISKIESIYNKLINDYEFNDYKLLNDEYLYNFIDNFKFKYSITTVDIMVNDIKYNLLTLDEINKLNTKLDYIVDVSNTKIDKSKYLDRLADNKENDLIRLEKKINSIETFINREEEYYDNLFKEVTDQTLNKYKIKHLKINENYLNNLIALNIGITVMPKSIIGLYFSSFFVARGLRTLVHGAIEKEEKTIYYYKNKFVDEIEDNLINIDLTINTILNSITDISKLKENFIREYDGYLVVEKYKNILNKLNEIEKKLKTKKNNLIKIQSKIIESKNKNDNKVKQLKIINKKRT